MEKIVKEGKDIDTLLNELLEENDLKKEEILWTTKEKKGKLFQGNLIEITAYKKEDINNTIKNFIKEIVENMGLEISFEIVTKDERTTIKMYTNNNPIIIGKEGRTLKALETLAKQKHEMIYDAKFIGLTLNRELLYERINERVDLMMEQGLLKEIESLMEKNYSSDLQSMKAIGYKEWFAYYDKKQTLQETIELIKKHSRNYAKRQYTWFNNQVPVNWFTVNLDDFDSTVDEVKGYLKKQGIKNENN